MGALLGDLRACHRASAALLALKSGHDICLADSLDIVDQEDTARAPDLVLMTVMICVSTAVHILALVHTEQGRCRFHLEDLEDNGFGQEQVRHLLAVWGWVRVLAVR